MSSDHFGTENAVTHAATAGLIISILGGAATIFAGEVLGSEALTHLGRYMGWYAVATVIPTIAARQVFLD